MMFQDIDQPVTMEERKELASRCRSELGLKRVIVVDGMDNAVWEAYGGLPNSAYILAPGGEIVFKEPWAKAEEWIPILEGLSGGGR
jgi:hypothetical protein